MSCSIAGSNVDPEDTHTCSPGTMSRWTPDQVFIAPISGKSDAWPREKYLLTDPKLDRDWAYIQSLPSPA